MKNFEWGEKFWVRKNVLGMEKKFGVGKYFGSGVYLMQKDLLDKSSSWRIRSSSSRTC